MLSKLHQKYMGLSVVLGTSAILAFYPTAVRGAYSEGVNAAFIVLITTFFRALSMVSYCWWSHKPIFPSRRSVLDAAHNGFYQFFSIAGVIGALFFLPGPVVMTIIFTFTSFLYVYMVFMGKERLYWGKISLALVALFGIGLVVKVFSQHANLPVIGVSLALLATLATTARTYRYSVQINDQSHPIVVGAGNFIFAFMYCLLLLFFYPMTTPLTEAGWIWSWIATLTLAIGSFGLFYGIKLMGAFQFSFFMKAEPVIGAVVAAFLIHDILSFSQYLGMAVVLGSLSAYQFLYARP